MRHDDPKGPHTGDDTEGMFPHLHHQENVDEHGHHVAQGDPHGHHVHVIPFWTMTAVFAALIVLTILTVLTAKGIYAGNAVNLVIALIIAGVKAILVAAFFMHLIWDRAINTVVVVATMFAVVLFISLSAIDLGTRGMANKLEEGEIVPGGGAVVTIDQDGVRSVSRKGNYEPWHSAAPASSVLDQARENYKAKKAHDGDHHDDDHHDDDH